LQTHAHADPSDCFTRGGFLIGGARLGFFFDLEEIVRLALDANLVLRQQPLFCMSVQIWASIVAPGVFPLVAQSRLSRIRLVISSACSGSPASLRT